MTFARWMLPALLLIGACETPGADGPHLGSGRLPARSTATAEDPFDPVPLAVQLDPAKVALGRRLFEDPRLSGAGDRACTTCHVLSQGGIVPGERRSNHPMNEAGPYNVPTVYNVAFNFRYNWNGKFVTLREHLSGPMMNPEVMDAGSWDALVSRLEPAYQQAFVDAGYADGVTKANIEDVFASYERSLVTPNSAFDRFLRGDEPLSEEARAGYDLFKEVGCVSCHQGINVGGNLFQRYGVLEDPFGGRPLTDRDYGRFMITGNPEDVHVFRVPSLRNVALTAPYFHDGSVDTLEEAVTHMARVQLGYALTEEEVRSIAAFLRSLTGEYQGVPLDRMGEP